MATAGRTAADNSRQLVVQPKKQQQQQLVSIGGRGLCRVVTNDTNRKETTTIVKTEREVLRIREMVVILDISGSMAGAKFAEATAGIRHLFDQVLNTTDKLSIWVFNSKVTEILPPTLKSEVDLSATLAMIPECGRQTAFHDAINEVMDKLCTPRKGVTMEVVALTDGCDNRSATTAAAIADRLAHPKIGCFKFIGIAVGSEGKPFVEALCAPQHCTMISVADGAAGVKEAFGKATKIIKTVRQQKTVVVETTTKCKDTYTSAGGGQQRMLGGGRPASGGAAKTVQPCKLCNVAFNSIAQRQQHISGQKHRKAAAAKGARG